MPSSTRFSTSVWRAFMGVPAHRRCELGFVQHARQCDVCALHGAQQAAQKPVQPRGHVQRAFWVASNWS